MARGSGRFSQFFKWFGNGNGNGIVAIDLDGDTEAESDNSGDVAVMEETAGGNGVVARRFGNSRGRDNAIEKLEKGYSEVLDLLQSVRGHMQDQSNRSERLLEIMEWLPEALKSMPEANRNQVRMLEVLQDHLQMQAKSGEQLGHSLKELTRLADNQDQGMIAFNQQLNAHQETSNNMLESFGAINGTLGKITGANETNTSVLRGLLAQTMSTDNSVRELFDRNRKQMLVMTIVTSALALVAIGMAGWVAAMLMRV